jgi:hypothetical protein
VCVCVCVWQTLQFGAEIICDPFCITNNASYSSGSSEQVGSFMRCLLYLSFCTVVVTLSFTVVFFIMSFFVLTN